MIQLNKCNITADGKHLILDVEVSNLSYYQDIYISDIIIITQKQFKIDGLPDPSENSVFTHIQTEADTKQYSTVIDVDSIGDNLFFIYFKMEGTLAADTPCGMKNMIALAVAYNPMILYNQGMPYINSLEGCNPSREFIDYILKYNAFKTALSTGNYTDAINLWNNIINVKQSLYVNHKCGCHG